MLTCSLATQKYLKSMFFSFLPSIFQSGRCFFICWRYVANFGILWHRKAPSGNKQARPVCKFRANKKLIIVSPNKTNPKKAMQFHRYGIFLDCFNMLQIFNLIPCPVVFSLGPLKSLPAHDVSLPCFCWSTSLGYHQAQASPFALASSTFWQQKIVPRKINK